MSNALIIFQQNNFAMKNLLSILALFTAFCHPVSTTRAVVIGISDYQDERIPDLQLAGMR